MTTEIHRRKANNLFQENEVYCCILDDWLPISELAGISWYCRAQDPITGHLRCCERATLEMSSSLSDYELWLLTVGVAVPLKDYTVPHKYKLLWYRMGLNAPNIPEGRTILPHFVDASDGICVYSAIQFNAVEIKKAVQLLAKNMHVTMAFLPKESENLVKTLVKKTWECSYFGLSKSICNEVLPKNGVVLKLIGAFDDIESGVVAFANPETIAAIL